jgi:hypothetical protein
MNMPSALETTKEIKPLRFIPTEFVAFCVNNCNVQILFGLYVKLDVRLHEYHTPLMRLFYIDTNGTNACLLSSGDH